jgi:hypothetical protein
VSQKTPETKSKMDLEMKKSVTGYEMKYNCMHYNGISPAYKEINIIG